MHFKIKLLLLTLIFPICVLANDDAHGGGHESGGGEHGEKAETKKGSGLPEWVELESRISSIEARVKSKENNIVKLLQEKKATDVKSPRMKEIIKELASEHREMRQGAEELSKQRTILKYRYPERGADPNRKYKKVEVKSLQEMEEAIGVDGRLSKTLQRVRQQYQHAPPAQKAAKPAPTVEPVENVEIEKSIILQK